MTPRREDSFIYKDPENLYKGLQKINTFSYKIVDEKAISEVHCDQKIISWIFLDPKHKTGNIGEEVKSSHTHKTNTFESNVQLIWQ